MDESAKTLRRKRRVKRLKVMIISTFFILVTVPIALCIWLGCRLHVTQNQLDEMTAQYEGQLKLTAQLQSEIDAYADYVPVIDETKQDDLPDTSADSKDMHMHKVYLTFDDGPSANTAKILDILDEYGVKATFFVTGEEADTNPERYQDIVNRGHSIGIHSYSHVYRDIYRSKEDFVRDYQKLRDYIEETTGMAPTIYRFPGGSSNTVSKTDMDELCEYLQSQGVTYYDWNVSSGDATNPALPTKMIVNNCVSSIGNRDTTIILLHDSGSKTSTVEALPEIIEQILAMDDTQILPIGEGTEVIQHRS
ncbi:MAG: polysaccharide deacetylase [Lachnospiraceae bacterium]|nr:polysaccharide deacetylase [Candidatus Colinaster equi]